MNDGDTTLPVNAWTELHVFNPTHNTRGTVRVEVLSSGTAVLSAAENRRIHNALCPNRRRVPGKRMKPCGCTLQIEGCRSRKGISGEVYVDPPFRWVLVVAPPGESQKGSAFTRKAAIDGVKLAAKGPGVTPVRLSVISVTYDEKNSGKMALSEVIYSAGWGPEGCRESIGLGNVGIPMNPGHGTEAEPLDIPIDWGDENDGPFAG